MTGIFIVKFSSDLEAGLIPGKGVQIIMILEDKLMLINGHPVEELIAEAILQIAADSPP